MELLKKVFSSISVIMAMMAALTALAQAQTPTLKTTPKIKEEKKKFSLSTSVEASTNMYRAGTYEHQADNSFQFGPSYAFTDNVSLSSKIVVIRNLTGDKSTVLAHTPITFTVGGFKMGEVRVKTRATAVLPTDRESVKYDTFQGAGSLGTDFSWSLSKKILPTSLIWGFSANRNIHEFTQNADGEANIQYSFSGNAGFGTDLTSTTKLLFIGTYTQAYTYENSPRSSFSASLLLEQELNKAFNLYAGTSNRGSAYRYNGVDSNISIYDEKSSVIFAGMGYSF